MQNNQFTCALCHQTFDKGWSDEEAITELQANFDTTDIADCDMVCDDCYKAMGFEL